MRLWKFRRRGEKSWFRNFGDTEILGDSLEKISTGIKDSFANLPAELRQWLEQGDHEKVSAWLADEMRAASLPLSGGRTPQAICERMFEKADLASARLDDDKRRALETFLAIDVSFEKAPDTLKKFEQDHAICLEGAREAVEKRIGGLSNHVSSLTSVRYRAGFGRRLDYYTGIVFEIFRPGLDRPVAGGGRYDRLMTLLGSTRTVPAVGFSIWVDRIGGGNK